jgi:hypothetical protein
MIVEQEIEKRIDVLNKLHKAVPGDVIEIFFDTRRALYVKTATGHYLNVVSGELLPCGVLVGGVFPANVYKKARIVLGEPA